MRQRYNYEALLLVKLFSGITYPVFFYMEAIEPTYLHIIAQKIGCAEYNHLNHLCSDDGGLNHNNFRTVLSILPIKTRSIIVVRIRSFTCNFVSLLFCIEE